jgi:glycosyltransferase involved in cell wall biosynthesis
VDLVSRGLSVRGDRAGDSAHLEDERTGSGGGNKTMLSIIVPVLNEAESLGQLLDEILAVRDAGAVELEVIFIDDGSTDASWSIIEDLSRQHEFVRGLRFRRNFAKAAALTAGMRAARGDRILMMDADLQDDPAEIPAFLAKLDEGYDVVNGWKQRRLDPWHKVYPSRVFNWLIGKLTGLKLHDHNCGLKLFRKEVADELNIYGEMHRFIAVLADARGFKVTELPSITGPAGSGIPSMVFGGSCGG